MKKIVAVLLVATGVICALTQEEVVNMMERKNAQITINKLQNNTARDIEIRNEQNEALVTVPAHSTIQWGHRVAMTGLVLPRVARNNNVKSAFSEKFEIHNWSAPGQNNRRWILFDVRIVDNAPSTIVAQLFNVGPQLGNADTKTFQFSIQQILPAPEVDYIAADMVFDENWDDSSVNLSYVERISMH